MRGSMKRVLIESDFHCGTHSGLTPVGFRSGEAQGKWKEVQKTVWNWRETMLDKWRPFDVYFNLGDCVDGSGAANGSVEQITTDPNEQAEMAAIAITRVQAKTCVIVAGTPYHSGKCGDVEKLVADKVNGHFSGWEQVDVNGRIFDLRHKVGRGSMPHTRATSVMRQWVNNAAWTELGVQKKADVFCRGHVHYGLGIFDYAMDRAFFTLPGYEWSTQFGTRQCDGFVNIGAMICDVEDNGEMKWKAEMLDLRQVAHEPLKA